MENLSTDYYQYFEVDDFVNDTFFRNWVIAPGEESDGFWKEYLMKFPGKADDVELAKMLLNSLKFEVQLPDEAHIHRQFVQHMEEVDSREKEVAAKIRRITMRRLAVAASLLVVILISAAMLFNATQRSAPRIVSYATGNGQLKHIILPDSSEIVLNANSTLRFDADWNTQAPRKVWIQGEAYFNVKHLNKGGKVTPHEHFYVYGKHIQVEVLGTSFNIRDRREKTTVVLQTGRVKLTTDNAGAHEWVMKPDDMVVYDEKQQAAQLSTTDAKKYTAWKDNKLILNNPTLMDIAAYLEDNFGKTIIVPDIRLREKHIEGPIMINSLKDALFIISTALHTSVHQSKDGNTITIHAK